jgi:hypothetical protein
MPKVSLAPWQYAAINNPFDHFAMYTGVAGGKTFSGSHFTIAQIIHHPAMTGFIGANTYDQLSQATLRELFYWLELYGLDYVIDCRPPPSWRCGRQLKTYKNTLHVKNPHTDAVTLIFTRVLSFANPLRGIEFSWYWLDETRDTPEDTHDVVLSRLRETPDYVKGIITTTTNGEDWSYRRFVVGADGSTYGSMHVATVESLKLGIITQKYYDTMRKSFSPMMALQELEAQHVNVFGGKAYYAASDANRLHRAPWGDDFPNRERPLVIGCDFNFSPAPCVWMVGQTGPNIFGPDGQDWAEHLHWFGEISGKEMSSIDMTNSLLMNYPDYYYRIFGDVSGGVGTTSNAGETDYHQIGGRLSDVQAAYSIDYFQADAEESRANPRVRSRVENVNLRLKDSTGQIRMTYDPARCPHLDSDFKLVGWKPTTSAGRGKLDDAGNCDLTHATDGAGYAIYKLFPPGRRLTIAPSLPSTLRADFGLLRANT